MEDVLENVDLVPVNVGQSRFLVGKKFIYQTIPKIQKLRRMMVERNVHAHIEIDGGVGLQNAEKLLQAGADVLVAGSSVSIRKTRRQISEQKEIGKVERFV
ncbi:MAG: hypothetical protein R2788_22535 [Saprospiraceae bacterium]